MKTNRAFVLLGVVLLLGCVGLAASLDRWFMGWQGNRATNFNPLKIAIGDSQKVFAGHFYRKADVYFHSGMYPSIFDNNESFKTAHIGEDAGATGSKNQGDEAMYLGQPRDIIDRFSRNFIPARHTHLDEGGVEGDLGDKSEVREILPWLKLAQELDPEDPLTYTVTAYWLRRKMGKTHEAELLLREGLKNLPDHPALLFELGRILFESNHDLLHARNVWRHAADEWQKQEETKADPDTFILEQIQTHLAKLEEDAGNVSLAISYWEQAKVHSPEPEAIQERINELRQKPSRSIVPP
jgi:tetratricopeptide (TPR) repeat protein